MKKIEETRKESKRVDFKQSFDFTSQQDKCEIVKDIVAMAYTTTKFFNNLRGCGFDSY